MQGHPLSIQGIHVVGVDIETHIVVGLGSFKVVVIVVFDGFFVDFLEFLSYFVFLGFIRLFALLNDEVPSSFQSPTVGFLSGV